MGSLLLEGLEPYQPSIALRLLPDGNRSPKTVAESASCPGI